MKITTLKNLSPIALVLGIGAQALAEPSLAKGEEDNSASYVETIEVTASTQIPAIREVLPKYPRILRSRGVEGKVTLAYDIDEKGKAHSFRVLEAEPTRIFVRSAKIALMKSRFAVQQEDGRPTEVKNQVRSYIYALENLPNYVATR